MTDEQIKKVAEAWVNSTEWITADRESFIRGAKWALSQPNPTVEKLKELRDNYVNTETYGLNRRSVIEQLNNIINETES